MDFKDLIKQLGERVNKLQNTVQTEEATKHSMILPFFQTLGYDVFNPSEINPEYIQDIGTKKGEKVDYAIMKDGEAIIIVECKHHTEKLDAHSSQLFRYFHVSKAKFGLLTNGVVYRFFTDLVEKNKMDEKPFLEFNITEPKDNLIEEVKKFHKSYFNVDNIYSTANELKYSSEIKNLIQEELNNPSAEFVRYFAKQVYDKVINEKALTQFTPIVKRAGITLINDSVNERLKNAIKSEEKIESNLTPTPTVSGVPISNEVESKIITTEIEKEAFFIVKSILRNQVSGERITFRDAQSYFSVFLDDNNRKPICRLYLDSQKKQIGILDDLKKELKYEIKSIDDIYNFSEQLVKTTFSYINSTVTV